MQLFKVGVLAAAVLGACCAAAAAKVPRVVTDMPVVHALVTQVMGDLGPVDLLLDRGGDVHSYQMRPSQAQALAAADVVFWVGPELTPWLVRVRETLAPQALSVPLLEVPGLALIAADGIMIMGTITITLMVLRTMIPQVMSSPMRRKATTRMRGLTHRLPSNG
jgi:ABC-type Zn2+ transport system substrate-binding protein/surface adhesin